jgi:hypothetical protein
MRGLIIGDSSQKRLEVLYKAGKLSGDTLLVQLLQSNVSNVFEAREMMLAMKEV